LSFSSRSVAVALVVAPTNRLFDARVTATDATGTGVTVTGTDACLPSLLTRMVVVPALRAVTSPDCDTVATDGSVLVNVTTRPVSSTLLRPRGVAVIRDVSPMNSAMDGGC